MTESIQRQIRDINKTPVDGYKMQTITCSAGISVAPYGAKSVKELLDNADMAVFHYFPLNPEFHALCLPLNGLPSKSNTTDIMISQAPPDISYIPE